MADKPKIGIVGVGRMGRLHLRKFVELSHCKVVGFFELDNTVAEEVSAEFGVDRHTDLSTLLFESDGLVIASPTDTHFGYAKRALDFGAHVLLEKPVSFRCAEAETLVHLAEEKELIFQVGFLERIRYQSLANREMCGPLRFINCNRLTSQLPRESVDVVMDLMIHDLDLVLSIVGEDPVRILATGASVVSSTYDTANARLEFPSGVIASLNASRLFPTQVRQMQVVSGKGATSFDFLKNIVDVFTKDETSGIKRDQITVEQLDPLRLQAIQFLQCIQRKTPPMVSGRDGWLALRLAEQVVREIDRQVAREVPLDWSEAPVVRETRLDG